MFIYHTYFLKILPLIYASLENPIGEHDIMYQDLIDETLHVVHKVYKVAPDGDQSQTQNM
jgi:hypothetical protein